jgi:hypothetical protein
MGDLVSEKIKRVFGVSDALESLAYNKKWTLENEDFSTLQWFEEDSEPPTEEQVNQEIVKLSQQESERSQAEKNAEIERQKAIESATEKLSKIGLSLEEIQAVIGIR